MLTKQFLWGIVWLLSSAVAFIIFVRAKKEERGQLLFRTQIDGYTYIENNDKNDANNDSKNTDNSNCNENGNDNHKE